MSVRRKPGEIVKRQPGSGFLNSAKPEFIKILDTDDYDPCMMGCGDPDCREWPNVEVLDENRVGTGDFLYHISECQMGDS